MNRTPSAVHADARRSRRRARGRRWAAALITGMGVTGTVLTPQSASADPVGPNFATANNASDPFAFKCAGPSTGAEMYCMVTSQDDNLPPIEEGKDGENYYPMSSTLAFSSKDGLKWTPQIGPALQESTIGRPGFEHLWAPTVNRVQHTVKGPANEYYLYTPDLTNKGDKCSSKIFVTSSTKPTSGYGSTNFPLTTTKYVQMQGAGYMSDPEVFVDSSTPTTSGTKYLLWADGDYGSCGGMSMRQMTSQTTLQPFTDPSEAWLSIDGPIQEQ